MKKCVVMLIGVFASAMAFGVTTYTWKAFSGSWDGSYTDTNHWGGVTYPGVWDAEESRLGDIAMFDFRSASHEGLNTTITLPDGVMTNYAGFYARTTKNCSITFSGPNTVFVMPLPTKGGSYTADTGYGIASAFAMLGGDAADDRICQFDWNGQQAKAAPLTFTNFVFTLTNAADEVRLRLDSGIFKIVKADYFQFFRGAPSAKRDRAVEVCRDASFDVVPTVSFHTFSTNNRIRVKGGKLRFASTIWSYGPYWGGNASTDVPRLVEISATEGGTFAFGDNSNQQQLALGHTSAGDTRAVTFRILADNGIVQQNNQNYAINTLGRGRHEFVFRNGSTGYFACPASLGNFETATGVVQAVDSTIGFKSAVKFGGQDAAKVTGGGYGIFSADHSTVAVTNVFTFYAGSMELKNGTFLSLGSKTASLKGDTTYGGAPAFAADGATITVLSGATEVPIAGFTTATIGAKGLTIEAPTAVTNQQAFANKEDENGVLTLSGAGAKTLAGANTVSKIDVLGGDATFAAAFSGILVATNGATVSFGGTAAAVPLAGLVLGAEATNGSLVLQPSEEIDVTGNVELKHIRLALGGAWALGSSAMIRVTGTVSAASQQAWTKTLVTAGLPSGCMWETHVEDIEGGKLLVIEIVEDAPIAITVDAGTETHTTNITYSAGITLETEVAADAKAAFTGDLGYGRFSKTGGGAAELSGANDFVGGVTIDGGLLSATTLQALGITSTGLGITLKDGTLELKSGGLFTGDLEINASQGANALVIIKNDGDVTMPIPTVSQGAFIKRGKGRLTLEVAEDTDWTHLSGNALGSMGSGETIELDTANGTAPGTDKHYGAVNVSEGELVFRGTGKDIPVITFNQTGRPGTDIGLSTTPTSDDFAQPGLVLDHVRYMLSTSANYADWFTMSMKFGASDPSAVSAPYLVVTNGASLDCTAFAPCWRNADARTCAHIFLDNGTIASHYEFHANENFNATAGVVTNFYTLRNGSRILSDYFAGRLYVYGQGAWFDVDASTIARTAEGDPLSLTLGQSARHCRADFVFRNGSLFACNDMRSSENTTQIPTYPSMPINLTFDDSEWYCGAGNLDMPSSNMNVTVTATGKGLKLNPPADAAWRLYTKVEGDGGIVKGGAGKLLVDRRFQYHAYTADPTTLAYTGATTVNEGTLEITGGALPGTEPKFALGGTGVLDLGDAAYTNADITVNGTGATLKNAKLTTPTVNLTYADAAFSQIRFDTVTFDGRVMFDFARTDEDPLPRKIESAQVGTWIGTKPDTSAWRGKATGVSGQRCTFVANDNGTITMSAAFGGFLIICR